jgi:hypothetical protein
MFIAVLDVGYPAALAGHISQSSFRELSASVVARIATDADKSA